MGYIKKRCSCCKEELLESHTFEVRDLKGRYVQVTLVGCRRCDRPKCVHCDKSIGQVHQPGLRIDRCEHCGKANPLVKEPAA